MKKLLSILFIFLFVISCKDQITEPETSHFEKKNANNDLVVESITIQNETGKIKITPNAITAYDLYDGVIAIVEFSTDPPTIDIKSTRRLLITTELINIESPKDFNITGDLYIDGEINSSFEAERKIKELESKL